MSAWWGCVWSTHPPPFSRSRSRTASKYLHVTRATRVADEDVLGLKVAVIYVLVEKVVAAPGQLQQEGQRGGLGEKTILLEVLLEVASYICRYPPGQN
jgi:hypothetical protein